jgi:hypothetical protein
MRYTASIPEITYPLRIDTIGKHIALGYEMHGSCEKCRHNGRLNLVRLAYKLGLDHGCLAPEIRPHVVCRECGAKEMGFITSSPGNCSNVHNRRRAGSIFDHLGR